MDGGIYSGIRRPGVQAKSASARKDDAPSPTKKPLLSPKLDLSAHARAPSILSSGKPNDKVDRSASKQSARLQRGGDSPSRQFGFSSSPASPKKR